MQTEFQDPVHSELGSDERLLWEGAPKTGLRLRRSDAALIPFSLLWGGFAIFWEFSVFHLNHTKGGGPQGVMFELWGVPFVLVGLYLIFGRFFADAYIRGRTRYAVTSQRVMIMTSSWGRRVRSLPLQTISEMSLSERPDGSGTITFGPDWPGNSFSRRSSFGNRNGPPVFEFVDGVRTVYDLIREAQESRSRNYRRWRVEMSFYLRDSFVLRRSAEVAAAKTEATCRRHLRARM